MLDLQSKSKATLAAIGLRALYMALGSERKHSCRTALSTTISIPLKVRDG